MDKAMDPEDRNTCSSWLSDSGVGILIKKKKL